MAPDEPKTERDLAWVRTVLVELSKLHVLSRTPITDDTSVQWGAAVHRDGDQLLVYGVIDEGAENLFRTKPPGTRLRVRDMVRSWRGRWGS